MSTKPYLNPTVEADIKKYDPALRAKWNPTINRWELWRQSRGREHFIVRIQEKDNGYRPLDNRIMRYLINNDGWQYKNAQAIAREMDEYDRKREEKEDREMKERLEWHAKERYRSIKNEMDGGKGDLKRTGIDETPYRENFDRIDWSK